jgi:peptide/nickel transport system substrate-binding protein
MTVGILPKHLWGSLSAEEFSFSSYNTNPIGTGPYKIDRVSQNKSGIPEYYDLVPFKNFSRGTPFIKKIRIRFYTGEEKCIEAYKNGEVDAVSAVMPKQAQKLGKTGERIETSPLPRTFGVFLNQNEQEVFTDTAVRGALNESIDRENIINSVLYGYGTKIKGPIPPGVIGFKNPPTEENLSEESRILAAKKILEKGGWVYNAENEVMEKISKGNKIQKNKTETLSFSLSTSDAPELREVAEKLKQNWRKIGAKVELKVFESGDLNQNIIRPRKYDALLFGEIVGKDPDPYAFWHSSQRFDPGLNIALYANITVDKILEKARNVSDNKERALLYNSFENEVLHDIPAIFLYSPSFIYLLPKDLKGVNLTGMTISSERFSGIADWYIETQSVWKVFASKK